MSDIDDLFETSLDDIEDLPEYADYVPTGHYTLEIVEAKRDTRETDDPEKKGAKIKAQVFHVTYEFISANEVKNEEEAALIKTREKDTKGMRFSETFWFNKDPKKSAEIVKAKYKEVAAKYGAKNIGELSDAMKGIMVGAIVSSTKAKDSERYYINTKNIQPL